MIVELLYFDGCPHWETADATLRQAAAEVGATVQHRRIVEDGDLRGFGGSPTILVDGHDPFPLAGPSEGLSCRLYATPAGPAGSPTLDQLRSALAPAAKGKVRVTDSSRRYTAVVAQDARRRVMVPVPFDPDEAWGTKREHRVHGTVNGMGVRAVIEALGDDRGILLGPAWRRDCGIGPGDRVDVVLAPEGPQREDLAPDVAAALEAKPEAGEFFDSLAQFYRRGYLRWIEATKRRPELRAQRITEMVELLKTGHKERPHPPEP